ncbi:MAG: hypothetical protein Q8N77_05760 [Nanoarchaeota archaeon]|nr:hypothetical protein [Nanoarchaeota archaeon]
MGSYSYSPPSKSPQQKCKESLENFLRNKKRNDLLTAYSHSMGGENGFISNLLSVLNTRELGKEVSDCEIEYKANLTLTPPSKLFSKSREITKKDIQEVHKAIQFDNNKIPYLKDTNEPQISTGQNHFYSANNAECFVLTHKNNQWNTKIKKFTNKYGFGIKGEEFVMRRKEAMSAINLPELINMVLNENKTKEIAYEGFMEKTKADQFLLNMDSGRVYNFTISLCKAKDRPDLVQLEIEYAGYVPATAFTKQTNSEKEIVQEILGIQDCIIQTYNNHKLKDYVLSFTPTTLTKFEWISGKTLSSEDKGKEKPLLEEQTFFGDTFK